MNLLLKQKSFLAGIMLVLGLSVFALPYISQAQTQTPAKKGGLVPCGGYNTDGTPEKPCTFLDIFAILARVTNWLIAMAGIYAVFRLINDGFWLVLSQGNEEAISKRKQGITSAIVGMVLTFMAFMLINTVINFILTAGRPGYRLDLTNPTCYLSFTTQNECFVSK